MLSSIWAILIKPDAFFHEILDKKVNLVIPALTVFVWSIVGIFSTYYYIFGQDIYLNSLPAVIINHWIFWFFVTVLFYILSLFFHGTGTFSRCLEVVGLGFLPQIIGNCVILVITFLFFGAPVMMFYQRIMTMAVLILFGIWSAYCWIYGIKQAQQLSLRNATISVGLPVLIYVILLPYFLFSVLL